MLVVLSRYQVVVDWGSFREELVIGRMSYWMGVWLLGGCTCLSLFAACLPVCLPSSISHSLKGSFWLYSPQTHNFAWLAWFVGFTQVKFRWFGKHKYHHQDNGFNQSGYAAIPSKACRMKNSSTQNSKVLADFPSKKCHENSMNACCLEGHRGLACADCWEDGHKALNVPRLHGMDWPNFVLKQSLKLLIPVQRFSVWFDDMAALRSSVMLFLVSGSHEFLLLEVIRLKGLSGNSFMAHTNPLWISVKQRLEISINNQFSCCFHHALDETLRCPSATL